MAQENLVSLFIYRGNRATLRIRVNQDTYYLRSNNWIESCNLFRALWVLSGKPVCDRRIVPLILAPDQTKGILEFTTYGHAGSFSRA